MGRFGSTEIIVVILFVIILFGAKKIPELMRSLGVGIKEFKSGLNNPDAKEKNNNPETDNDIKAKG